MPDTAVATPTHKELDTQAKKLKLTFPPKANIATKVELLEAHKTAPISPVESTNDANNDATASEEPKAAKKASAPNAGKQARAAELETEIGQIVHAAQTAGDWQPAAADRCREAAEEIRELLGNDAELSPLISRWLT